MESLLELRLTLLYRWRTKKLAITTPTIAPNRRPPILDPTTTPTAMPEFLDETSNLQTLDQPGPDDGLLTQDQWKDTCLARPLHCAWVRKPTKDRLHRSR